MTERANPFASDALPAFAPKPKAEKPVDVAAVERVSRENNFPSRSPVRAPSAAAPTRKARRNITGRNRQFNIKATAETIDRFYKLADERRIPLGELLEHAVKALESQK